ncbi:MAG: DUF4239 domain-containing protein [Candidatus Obscuribacterales bacterium]|nr:DUF4239 domain-containing protein [Candidatus Obscuribacterales bacterium]
MDSIFGGALLVFAATGLAILGLLAARKMFDLQKLRESHEVGGYLLSVVGTLYAVLLGLIVVDAMAKFQTARTVTEEEANNLADVFVLAASLPKEMCNHIRKDCIDYTNQVIKSEWAKMDKGEVDVEARRIIVHMNVELSSFEPQTENQKAIYPLLLGAASDVWHTRRERTNFAIHGPPVVEWVSLVIGSIITVFFTYFFNSEHFKIQVVMTSMVALLISLNLYLFLLFSYPFSGDVCVGADPFEVDLMIFQHRFSDRSGAPAVED